MEDNSLRLHLGCGSIHIDGYVNIDKIHTPAVDVIDDVQYLREFEQNSVDLIYASNLLEHIGKFEYKLALQRWYELLKEGGKLKLSVPNFEALCEYYLETKDLKSLYPALYAGQDSLWNYHLWCWDFATLKEDLEGVGFKDIKKWDDHPVRDWSINYVPYWKDRIRLLDEEWFKGKFIALNVEGVK